MRSELCSICPVSSGHFSSRNLPNSVVIFVSNRKFFSYLYLIKIWLHLFFEISHTIFFFWKTELTKWMWMINITFLFWVLTSGQALPFLFLYINLNPSNLVVRASLVAQMVKHLPAIRETQVQSPGQGDPLEKEMATHSSTLAWKIPWTEEPGRLQPMGSQRVRHHWATSLSL